MIYLIQQMKRLAGKTNEVSIFVTKSQEGQDMGTCERVTYAKSLKKAYEIADRWGIEAYEKGKKVFRF